MASETTTTAAAAAAGAAAGAPISTPRRPLNNLSLNNQQRAPAETGAKDGAAPAARCGPAAGGGAAVARSRAAAGPAGSSSPDVEIDLLVVLCCVCVIVHVAAAAKAKEQLPPPPKPTTVQQFVDWLRLWTPRFLLVVLGVVLHWILVFLMDVHE